VQTEHRLEAYAVLHYPVASSVRVHGSSSRDEVESIGINVMWQVDPGSPGSDGASPRRRLASKMLI
jgi:hypothetical protein